MPFTQVLLLYCGLIMVCRVILSKKNKKTEQDVWIDCVVSNDLALQRKPIYQFLVDLFLVTNTNDSLFFLHREHLDPYFSEMFRPIGRLLTGLRRDRGDSSVASGNSGSIQMRATWWVKQWGGGISRTVTPLSANTFPAVMEELVSGTRLPFTWDIEKEFELDSH